MITPGRLPLARDELVGWWEGGLAAMLRATTQPLHLPYSNGRPEPISAYQRRLTTWLRVAELYWVTDQMTAVAITAGQSLPQYRLHAEDVPAQVGLLVWAGPVATVQGDGEIAVVGCLWGPAVDHLGRPGVQVVTLYDPTHQAETLPPEKADFATYARDLGRLGYHDEYTLCWSHLATDAEDRVLSQPIRNEAIRTVLATWLLCGQQIVATPQAPADRPVRRAYARQGRPEPLVRTVTLRRATQPAHQDDQETAGQGRTYRHQWVVQGHWRQQWYPSRGDHRPVYVHDYVKGPPDAPLLGGDRINVLRR